jgi:pilus assembly protein CpaE
MAGTIRTLVVLDGSLSEDEIAPSLPTGGGVEVVAVVPGIDRAATMLGDTPCDVLVIACAGYSERVLLFTETAVQVAPHRPVIILSTGSPNGFVRRAFEVGADDLVPLPHSADGVRFAIEKAIARRERVSVRSDGAIGKLIVVLGPKGGTGKTLTATNLSVALQQAGKTVALVDLDLQFGDVALSLGITPKKTLHDLVESGVTVDEENIDEFLATHQSGVKVLMAPSRPDQASAVTVELIREIYTVLRRIYDVVIVDTPPGFTSEVIASIDMSTDLVMIGMLDSLSLKNTKLGLETLDLMRYDPENVRVVLNRAHSRVGISTTSVSRVLGREPDVFVPSDREIPRTINEGVPIVSTLPRSDVAESFRTLAALYADGAIVVPEQHVGEEAEAETVPPRRRFGRRG